MTGQPLKTIILDLLEQGHQDMEDFLQNLSETERVAIGTPHLWAAKDHLAHRMFWHRRRLTALQQHSEIVESEEDADQLNSRNFEEHRLRPFSEIYVEAERVYTELITTISHLDEEDLTAPGRFPFRRRAAVYRLPGPLLRARTGASRAVLFRPSQPPSGDPHP